MSRVRGTTAFWIGKAGEVKVSQWLQQQGYTMIPMEREDHGPQITRGCAKKRLMDFLVARTDGAKWVEVKCKDSPVLFQKRHELRHGIDLPNWEDYLEVEALFRTPAFLAILQRKPEVTAEPAPVVLFQSFSNLRQSLIPAFSPNRKFPYGAVYWRIQSFDAYPMPEWTREVSAWETIRTSVRPWEQRSKDGLTPLQVESRRIEKKARRKRVIEPSLFDGLEEQYDF